MSKENTSHPSKKSNYPHLILQNDNNNESYMAGFFSKIINSVLNCVY